MILRAHLIYAFLWTARGLCSTPCVASPRSMVDMISLVFLMVHTLLMQQPCGGPYGSHAAYATTQTVFLMDHTQLMQHTPCVALHDFSLRASHLCVAWHNLWSACISSTLSYGLHAVYGRHNWHPLSNS